MTFYNGILLINLIAFMCFGGIIVDMVWTLWTRRRKVTSRARRNAEIAVVLIPFSIAMSVVWVLIQFMQNAPTLHTLEWHFPLALMRMICGIVAVVLVFESRRQERRLQRGNRTDAAGD